MKTILAILVLGIFLGSVPLEKWVDATKAPVILVMSARFFEIYAECAAVEVEVVEGENAVNFYGTCREWSI